MEETFHIDAVKFHEFLTENLYTNINGCTLQLRQNGKTQYQHAVGHARKEKDGNFLWNQNTRMHIASCSKLITAVATLKALKASAVSVNARISLHLPRYWKVHDDLNNILDGKGLTFKH